MGCAPSVHATPLLADEKAAALAAEDQDGKPAPLKPASKGGLVAVIPRASSPAKFWSCRCHPALKGHAAFLSYRVWCDGPTW